MFITTGRMKDPARHHKGWIRIFRFRWTVEIWVGSVYVIVGR